jgi:predicted ATPase
MGVVYRARDEASGEPVAIKVFTAKNVARFHRESALVAELNHPAIVRYVAHGSAPDGQPFLVMEWLEGEDLSARLARGPLPIEDAVSLGVRVAGALGFLHARGIVHRDVKPSNVFLPGGDVRAATLLDLGVAHMAGASRVTRTGATIGTPGYMAPEQARGMPDVDGRADVFSLGCVVFESIAGRAPFIGDHPVAVLARILLEEPPRAGELRAGVPVELEQLIATMLSKLPDERPRDGADAATALARMAGLSAVAGTLTDSGMPTSLRAIAKTEQRVVSLVLSGAAGPGTIASEEGEQLEDVAAAIARVPGARVDGIADGSLLVTFEGDGEATDQASKAALAALRLRALLPDVPISVATGSLIVASVEGGSARIGDAIDRAARALSSVRPPAIAVDEDTARLVDARFVVREVRGSADARELVGDWRIPLGARTLLGRPTACVGRERELTVLRAVLDECVSDGVARAALVTGPAGIGKSRLMHELLRRAVPPRVLVARGDPVAAGSPLGLAAQLVRDAVGLLDGEPTLTKADKIERYARAMLPAEQARDDAELLGELLGVAIGSGERTVLRVARRDAVVIGDRMRGAFERLLEAELRRGPLALVLEDLHWGDRPTVGWIDGALRNLKEHPLFVLALARPEIMSTFPRLWAERSIVEMGLGELSRKAAEALAREVLGEVDPATLARIVAQAGGNAFYLEELLRVEAGELDSVRRGDANPTSHSREHARDPARDRVPRTLLAMVQTRLSDLPSDARRCLRAASVFGQVFHAGGVAQLLRGSDGVSQHVEELLAELVARELVEARPQSRFPGEPEYGFRQALVREAAYATFTEVDLQLAHRLAGRWLERAGERDSLALAEHYRRGALAERSLRALSRAAEQALEGNDFEDAIACVAKGRAVGAAGETLGRLLALAAEAARWRGDATTEIAFASEALALLDPVSEAALSALSDVASASARLGDRARAEVLSSQLLALNVPVETAPARAGAIARVAIALCETGARGFASHLLAALEQLAPTLVDDDVIAEAHAARAAAALSEGDASASLDAIEAAERCYLSAGDLRSACLARVKRGHAHAVLGLYADAEAIVVSAQHDAERMGLGRVAALAKKTLAVALARMNRLDEAEEIAHQALPALAGDPRAAGACRTLLAEVLLARGDPEGARDEAKAAAEQLVGAPMRLVALAFGAEAELLDGNPFVALGLTKEAMKELEEIGSLEDGESLVRLAHAEALFSTGDRKRASAVIRDAESRLRARADRIVDERRRASFLELVPENQRVVAMAAMWAR